MTYELCISFYCTKYDYEESKPLDFTIVANVITPTGYSDYSPMFIDLTNQKPSQEQFDLPMFVCAESDLKRGPYCHLKTHLILHTSETTFQCYERRYDLFDLSMFACTECDYKCKYCYFFKPHIILHTCEYPFLCYVCNIIVMTIQPLKVFKLIYRMLMLNIRLDIYTFCNVHKNPSIYNLIIYMPFPWTECDLIYHTIKPLLHSCHIITYKDILMYNIDRKCCYHIFLYRFTNTILNSDCNLFNNVQYRRG